MVPERSGMLANVLLVWCAVHAERLDEALIVDGDMAVLPDDLRELLFGEHARAAPDDGHLVHVDVEGSDDEVARHAARNRTAAAALGEAHGRQCRATANRPDREGGCP